MSFTLSKTNEDQVLLSQARLFDERSASLYLAISIETLRSWRKQDRGPRYSRIGRCIRYSTADLLAFVETAPSGGGRPWDRSHGMHMPGFPTTPPHHDTVSVRAARITPRTIQEPDVDLPAGQDSRSNVEAVVCAPNGQSEQSA
jgi:hypothetical protein